MFGFLFSVWRTKFNSTVYPRVKTFFFFFYFFFALFLANWCLQFMLIPQTKKRGGNFVEDFYFEDTSLLTPSIFSCFTPTHCACDIKYLHPSKFTHFNFELSVSSFFFFFLNQRFFCFCFYFFPFLTCLSSVHIFCVCSFCFQACRLSLFLLQTAFLVFFFKFNFILIIVDIFLEIMCNILKRNQSLFLAACKICVGALTGLVRFMFIDSFNDLQRKICIFSTDIFCQNTFLSGFFKRNN